MRVSTSLDRPTQLCTRPDDQRVATKCLWKVSDHLARRNEGRTADRKYGEASRSGNFGNDVPYREPACVVDRHPCLGMVETEHIGCAIGRDEASPPIATVCQERLQNREGSHAVAVCCLAISESLKEDVERHDDQSGGSTRAERAFGAIPPSLVCPLGLG